MSRIQGLRRRWRCRNRDFLSTKITKGTKGVGFVFFVDFVNGDGASFSQALRAMEMAD